MVEQDVPQIGEVEAGALPRLAQPQPERLPGVPAQNALPALPAEPHLVLLAVEADDEQGGLQPLPSPSA